MPPKSKVHIVDNTLKKNGGKKITESNFIITVSSNKDFETIDPIIARRFAMITSHTFEEDDDLLISYLKDRTKGGAPPNASDIKEITLVASLEVGKKYRKLHYQVGLRVLHTTNLLVNCPVIADNYADIYEGFPQFKGQRIYCHAEWVKGGFNVAAQYAQKKNP